MLKGSGIVRYSGYQNGGVVQPKGMKNKRKKKIRIRKEIESFERQKRLQEESERERYWDNAWEDYDVE